MTTAEGWVTEGILTKGILFSLSVGNVVRLKMIGVIERGPETRCWISSWAEQWTADE